MSAHIVAALFLFAVSAAIYVHGWYARGQSELDRHIAEALDVANTPDYEANIAARWIG